MAEETPAGAYYLSLIGGIFVIIGGVVAAAFGALITFFLFGVGAIIGILGIVWGVLILVFANRLRSNPESHATSGVLILVFSLLSWFGGFGGFGIGFLLAFIGGILAIVWNPQPQSMVQQQPPPPAMAQGGMKFCPNCGTQMAAAATFCPKCGAKQP